MQPISGEYLFTIRAALAAPVSVGPMRHGERRYVPITGGTVAGPAFTGTVLPLGGDSQLVVSDTLVQVSAHYFLRSRDGVGISVFNRGLRRADAAVTRRLLGGERVAADEYYFRTAPRFEAPTDSGYGWLNESLFLGRAERERDEAIIHVHRLL